MKSSFIAIKSRAQEKRMRELIMQLLKKQEELEVEDNLAKPSVSMGLAVKYDLLFPEFLFHKKIFKVVKFHEQVKMIYSKDELAKAISDVLEYEMTCDIKDEVLPDKVRDKLIKTFNKLTKKKATKDAEL